MIVQDYIVEWGKSVPWANPLHVEQGLIISRILVEMFNHPKLSSSQIIVRYFCGSEYRIIKHCTLKAVGAQC